MAWFSTMIDGFFVKTRFFILQMHPFLKENESKYIDVTGWLRRIKLSVAELPDGK